jgi:hypothetical protein
MRTFGRWYSSTPFNPRQKRNMSVIDKGLSVYRAVNAVKKKSSVQRSRLCTSVEQNQSDNNAKGKIPCLFSDTYKTQTQYKHHVEFLNVKPDGT